MEGKLLITCDDYLNSQIFNIVKKNTIEILLAIFNTRPQYSNKDAIPLSTETKITATVHM